MDKRKILIQLDPDPHPSVFDRVVAVDAGADEVFSYGGVRPEQVRDLVHGAIFTRSARELNQTAIFVGGSDVAAGEKLAEEAMRHMIPQFGLRVSLLLDASGANTTAAAAVWAASRHLDLQGKTALVLAATGPVGQRVARLLVRQGAAVRAASRQQSRADAVCAAIKARIEGAKIEAFAASNSDEVLNALQGCQLVVSAGAAGILLLPKSVRLACPDLRVAIDLNAVPPLGVEGVEVTDKAVSRDGVVCYGAIGVGATKMKLHKAAIAKLFETNDQVLDAEEVYALAATI